MKKTVTVNLNGKVFAMDEDACRLLEKYLDNMRIYFCREEGSPESITGFEAGIEKLFSEHIRTGYEVIAVRQVEEAIAEIGKPAGFGDPENRKDEKQTFQERKTFFRNGDNKMLGGLCSGLAARFGWNVAVVRSIAVVLLFASSFTAVPVYLLAWIIFPAAKTAAEKLQMQGMPVTVENIGKTVAEEAVQTGKSENRGCREGFFEATLTLMKIGLTGLGCLIGLPLIFALILVIVVLFTVLFGAGGGLLAALPFGFVRDISFLTIDHPLLASAAFISVIGIPLAVFIYSMVAGIAKFTPVSKSLKWIILAVWILALILLLSSGIRIDNGAGRGGWQVNAVDDIRGGDSYTEQEYVIDQPYTGIDLDDDLICNTQIEQAVEGPATITVSGSERLVKYVRYEVKKERLRLFAPEWKKWHIGKKFSAGQEQVDIRINTTGVKEIESNSVGNVWIAGAFKADSLKLELDGIGKFRADGLNVRFLKATSGGIGEMILGGQARKAEFEMEGAGLINALEMVADSVYAKVEGVGSVKCNPVAYLKGKVTGIGSLTYREEPREKRTEMSGIGRIGKE
ncbi:MAG: DUF2807 domain-containing protein [Dysgonamonadaceae bacterium]|nr:DUF2807 domain-containing protein [Dysgonamonadaceae bacterium]